MKTKEENTSTKFVEKELLNDSFIIPKKVADIIDSLQATIKKLEKDNKNDQKDEDMNEKELKDMCEKQKKLEDENAELKKSMDSMAKRFDAMEEEKKKKDEEEKEKKDEKEEKKEDEDKDPAVSKSPKEVPAMNDAKEVKSQLDSALAKLAKYEADSSAKKGKKEFIKDTKLIKCEDTHDAIYNRSRIWKDCKTPLDYENLCESVEDSLEIERLERSA